MEPAPPLPAAVSPEEARRLLARALKGVASEKIAVLHLDADRRLLALRQYRGSANTAEVPLRSIIGEALRLGTSFLVMAHNHPSGDANPSAEDLRVSRIVADTARNLGIRLIDHIIFAGKDAQSLRDLGLL